MAATDAEKQALLDRVYQVHGTQVARIAATRSLFEGMVAHYMKHTGADMVQHLRVLRECIAAKLRELDLCPSLVDAADDDFELMQKTIALLDAIPD